MLAMMPHLPSATYQYRPVGNIRDLFINRDPEVLGVGPAGTGKTLGLAYKCHAISNRYPGSRGAIIRKTLESLKSGALNTYINGVKPLQHGIETFGGNKFYPAEFRYPNGSVIMVFGMDKPDKLLSAEFDWVYVNEVTELTESEYEVIKSRLRNGAMPYRQLMSDCNPAGPRHWMNQRCIAGKTTRINTNHKDNPAYWNDAAQEWTPLGREYVMGTLAGLSGIQRKRFFEGVWAAAEGLVYSEFNPDQHVRTVDTTGWRTVLGVDVGSRNPTAILVAHVAGDGRIHISHELYRRNMSASDILSAIQQFDRDYNPEAVYIDPSAKGYIEDIQRAGINAVPAVNDVLVGIQRVHAQFQTGLTFDPECSNLIDELGMYAYPDNPKVETDKPIKDNDHAADALRYLVMGASEPVFDMLGLLQSQLGGNQ